MEQVQNIETPKTDISYDMTEDQKATLMAPVLKAAREDVLKQELFEQIETQVPNPHPILSEEKITEMIAFGMLAHVKYGHPIEECVKLVNEAKAIDWCFDRFVLSEDFTKATDDMTIVEMDGVKVSHNVDTNDLNQIAQIIQPVLERFSKDLKNSSVFYVALNYFNIKMKQALKHGERFTREKAFQAACGCVLHKYYSVEQPEALRMAIAGEAAKEVFLKHMHDAVSKTIEAKEATKVEEVEESVIQ